MARLVIEVLARAAQAKKEFASLDKSTASVGDKLKTLRGPAAVALGGVAAAGLKAVNMASDLNETVSKSQQIFGAQAGAMETWSQGAAKAFGLSQAEALNAATSFGDMFSQIGFGGKQAADMSKAVVGLSADLGSFNNLPTADVNDRISAAFRGEYDSLQALIPNINAARVETEAMAATGKKSAKELTAQEKASAVLAIVQKDGAKAAGDFARTQDGAANKTKIAQAQAADLAASLGQRLLPAYAGALGMASQFLDFLGQNQGAVAGVVAGIGALAAILLVASAATTIYNGAMAVARIASVAYTAVQWLLNAALTANPIGLIVVGIGLLIAGLVLAWKHSETFRAVVTGAFQAVAAVASAVWGWIKTTAVAAWGAITAYVAGVVGRFHAFMGGLRDLAVAAWNGIKAAAVAVWGAIVAYVAGVVARAKNLVNGLKTLAIQAWNGIKASAQAVWNFIKSYIQMQIRIVTGLLNGLKTLALFVWTAIKRGAALAWNTIKAAVTAVINGAISKFNSLKNTASTVLSRIKSLFSPGALINAGRQLISGLATGIRQKIDAAVGAVRAGVQKIKNLLPGSPIKDGPLKSWNNGGAGKRLMALLAKGLRVGGRDVERELEGVLAGFANPTLTPSVSLGASDLPATAAGGGTVQQITLEVKVDPTTNLAEVGRELTKALSAYKRAGGKLVPA